MAKRTYQCAELPACKEVRPDLAEVHAQVLQETRKLINQYGLIALEALIVRVNPAYTSQICSCCGHRQEMPLSVRVYECPNCSLVMNRDHNSSVNILDEALHELQACGRAGRVIPEAPGL